MYDEIEENIEYIANNFENLTPDISFMKEKITDFYFPTKFKINFKDCHIAISRNGGLMAICKKKSFLDTQRNSKVNDNILVLSQNARKHYSIPIIWDNKTRYIISFDFTENGKLYGICNDGTIYKFYILTLQAKEIVTGDEFKKDKIYKAKFIENGFIALTEKTRTFYYVKEFKDISPISIFQVNSLLEFPDDIDIDFFAIPPSASKSRKLELFFTNAKGNGVIHVMEQPKVFNYGILPIDNNETDLTISGVSVLENKELEASIKKENGIITSESNINQDKENIGKIVAMAISPSYSQFCLYNDEGIAYLFKSQFDSERKEIQFQINAELSKAEINEQKAIINCANEFQFLFVGEDAIAICGQRFILIANSTKNTLVYKIVEGESMLAMQGGVFSKCISEVDGLRYATNEGIFFISKVNPDLYKVCYPFSDHPAKKLLKAYKSDLMKEAYCYKQINEIYKDLPNIILVLANAAANLFWTEENDINKNKKEIQFFLFKAAQLGKYFVDQEEFRLDKYIDICKNTRILNEIRNNKESPIFITYKEFETIQYKEFIKNIMSQLNFKLAYNYSKFLGYSIKRVYQKWACCKIKKLSEFSTNSQQMKIFEEIMKELQNFNKISFIKFAKKAFKCKQNDLGMKFLELEKSVLAKIPQYIKHSKWGKALELSYETYDSEIIATCLNEIVGYNRIDKDFIDKVKDVKNIRYSVVDYLKKNRPIFIENYLDAQGDYEELFLLMLENFFTKNTIEDKKKYIKLAKEYLKNIDKTNINHKFYSLYLTELENSITFKKNSMNIERNIIKKNDIVPFDNSIYDCYKLGVKANEFKWIEGQNKNFNLNAKKMAVMRIRAMAENGKIDMIEKMVKESSLKKLNLTPLNLAELYFDFKKYDLAVEYIKQMDNSEYFDYKVDMLIYMEKYEVALETIISSKYTDKIPNLVNEILIKEPSLQEKVKKLCADYKDNLN